MSVRIEKTICSSYINQVFLYLLKEKGALQRLAHPDEIHGNAEDGLKFFFYLAALEEIRLSLIHYVNVAPVRLLVAGDGTEQRHATDAIALCPVIEIIPKDSYDVC